MRVLVLGQGGREHALVRALKSSPSVHEVHAAPGSAGIGLEVLCHSWDGADHGALLQIVKKHDFDLVVVGPEVYLSHGIADSLQKEGIPVFGPGLMGAQLEASKIFAKKFMLDAGVPTARFNVVESLTELLSAAKEYQPPYVLKADGLAAGKGVVICKNQQELEQAGHDLFVAKKLGDAANKVLLEEFQPGWELSFLILTNGQGFQSLPLAQDHKQLLDGDKGPNTGGMGVVAPLNIDSKLRQQILERIVAPSVKQLGAQGLRYQGVLFIGVMVTASGPMVLEYNVRFGDPEAQAILPLLDGDWGQVFLNVAKGNLPDLKWKNIASACVVMAAAGYPEQPRKNDVIHGDIGHQTPSSYFLHAGTGRAPDGQWVTNGGRVFNAVAVGTSSVEAIGNAYEQAKRVTWPGMQMRRDIGLRPNKF